MKPDPEEYPIHHCPCGSGLWHLKYDGSVVCAKCLKSPPNTHVIINEEPLDQDGSEKMGRDDA